MEGKPPVRGEGTLLAMKVAELMKHTKAYLTIIALATTSLVASAADATANWEKSCQKCHGADGKGDTKIGKKMEVKDLTDAKYQASFTDEQAFKAIKEGIKDGDKTKMKPAEDMTDDDIKALVAKVRAFKG
jgi:cytochrome c553